MQKELESLRRVRAAVAGHFLRRGPGAWRRGRAGDLAAPGLHRHLGPAALSVRLFRIRPVPDLPAVFAHAGNHAQNARRVPVGDLAARRELGIGARHRLELGAESIPGGLLQGVRLRLRAVLALQDMRGCQAETGEGRRHASIPTRPDRQWRPPGSMFSPRPVRRDCPSRWCGPTTARRITMPWCWWSDLGGVIDGRQEKELHECDDDSIGGPAARCASLSHPSHPTVLRSRGRFQRPGDCRHAGSRGGCS